MTPQLDDIGFGFGCGDAFKYACTLATLYANMVDDLGFMDSDGLKCGSFTFSWKI